jgi:hypothetical protein
VKRSGQDRLFKMLFLLNSINLPATQDGPSYAMRERGLVFSLARSRWSLEHIRRRSSGAMAGQAENSERIIFFGLIR